MFRFFILPENESFSLENIDIIKTYRKQQQAEIAYSIESHKCPRCGASILQKGNIFKCYKCDFNFKL